MATSDLCFIVRLLPANAKIWNVVIDGIVDTTPDDCTHAATILFGDDGYGKNPEDGLRYITLSNVVCKAECGIDISGYLYDSIVTNIINKNPNAPTVIVRKENGLCNVKFGEEIKVLN